MYTQTKSDLPNNGIQTWLNKVPKALQYGRIQGESYTM